MTMERTSMNARNGNTMDASAREGVVMRKKGMGSSWLKGLALALTAVVLQVSILLIFRK